MYKSPEDDAAHHPAILRAHAGATVWSVDPFPHTFEGSPWAIMHHGAALLHSRVGRSPSPAGRSPDAQVVNAGSCAHSYSCECQRGSWDDSVRDAVPRLEANTSLETLQVTVRFENTSLSLPAIQRILSDIRSAHLRQLHIFPISSHSETTQDENKASLSETYPPDSTSAFHAILSHNIFDELPIKSVLIWPYTFDKNVDGIRVCNCIPYAHSVRPVVASQSLIAP